MATSKKATPVKKVVVKETVVEKPTEVKVQPKVVTEPVKAVEKPVEVKDAPIAVAHVEIKGEKIMRDIGAEVRDVIDAKKAEPVNDTTFDNFVIREIMHQKGVTWERAVEILSNPS